MIWLSDPADSAIVPGSTYVVTPTAKMIDSMGYSSAWAILPRISVSSVPDFSACDADLICPSGTELAAQLTVDFVDTAAADAAVAQRVQGTVSPLAPFTRRTLELSSGGVDMLFDEGSPKGSGAQGVVKVSACPKNGLEAATIYYYDTPPLSSVLSQTASAGYGAVTRTTVLATDCCEPGSQLEVSGVRVVVIRQMDAEPLSVAELEIFSSALGAGNVAPSHAKCFSFPSSGSYYSGDTATGRQGAINDGDASTFSHSGAPNVADEKYDVCVLNQTVEVQQVTVTPRQSWWGRSENFQVEFYSHLTTDGPGGIGFTGQLLNVSLVHSGSWQNEVVSLPAAAQLPTSVACPNAAPRRHSTQSDLEVVSITGEAYVRVVPGSPDDLVAVSGQVDVEASNNASACAGGAYLEVEGDVAVCQPCPDSAMSFAGKLATCKESGKVCSGMIVLGTLPLGLDARAYGLHTAAFEGQDQYVSVSGAAIRWSASDQSWHLTNSAGALVASRSAASVGPFTRVASSMTGASNPPTGVRAIIIEQAKADYLNLCEIQMLVNGQNIAPTHATCWLLQAAGPGGYWFTGDKTTGQQMSLNDDCLHQSEGCSCAHTAAQIVGDAILCTLNQTMPVDALQVYINSAWPTRSKNLNVKVFSEFPEEHASLPTHADIADLLPFWTSYNTDMSVAANCFFRFCYFSVTGSSPPTVVTAPPPPGYTPSTQCVGSDAECEACQETSTWGEALALDAVGRFVTGGLGGIMVDRKFLVQKRFL